MILPKKGKDIKVSIHLAKVLKWKNKENKERDFEEPSTKDFLRALRTMGTHIE